jgi:hypothetical protein
MMGGLLMAASCFSDYPRFDVAGTEGVNVDGGARQTGAGGGRTDEL